MLYAHTPPTGSNQWHELGAHLDAVASRAAANAAKFGGSEVARWAGLWHDIGKANPEFQRYLERCYHDGRRSGRSVEHKGAGILAVRNADPHVSALAFLIQGHHGGLPNASDLRTRIKSLKDDLGAAAGYAAAEQAGFLRHDVESPGREIFPSFLFDECDRVIPAKLAFFLRMCFSALVDADHWDTERHRAPKPAAVRGGAPSIGDLAAQLSDAQRSFLVPTDDDPDQVRAVAAVRDEVYRACLVWSGENPGFFRLTVPTGGGKTRSSLAFALNHVLHHQANSSRPFGLERVIVAVPYLTITEQTADDYRRVFRDARAVLEHHSGLPTRVAKRAEVDRWNEEEGAESLDELWRVLTTQDWDAPVVVTTTVQLFESLFGHRPASCRKLHRIARSVVILDEAQTLPAPLLQPILDALRNLVADYGASVVLCTATQPALDETPGFRGLPNVREIAPDPPKLFEVLKRVEYTWPTCGETWTWAEAADAMQSEAQALAIVNTRADALALLAALGDDQDAFHLSTLLCGAHRRDVLKVIRGRLKEGRLCRVVSTQVVEAGVDLDFPLVVRAMGPLDRIVQAAGRCNREGRWASKGRVIVFDPAEAQSLPRGVYQTATALARVRLARGQLNLDHPDTFKDYFLHLYREIRNLDHWEVERLENELQFEDVSQAFQIIEDDTVSVVVRYKGLRADLREELGYEECVPHNIVSRILLDDLRKGASGQTAIDGRAFFTEAQPYLVGRRRWEFDDDLRAEHVSGPVGGLWIWECGYHEMRGLIVDLPPEDFLF